MQIYPKENELYKDYINRILNSRSNLRDEDEYQEVHHIIPHCMGGNDDESNLIYLYAQEHYYAHKLLALENPNDTGLQYAWWMMSHQSTYVVTAEEYAEVRKRFSQIHSNRFVSKETREKLSRLHKGKHLGAEHWGYGKKRPQEVREKISKNKKGRFTKENNSNAKRVQCIETGEIFNTMMDAAEFAGVKISTMSSHCSGHIKKIKNKYTFKIIE